MPIDYVAIIKWIWQRVAHLAIYILLLILIVGGPYLIFRHGVNKGAQDWAAMHPQNLFSGPTQVIQNKLPNTILAIGRFQLDWRTDSTPLGKVVK